MKKIALFLISFYKNISFLFPSKCIYTPSCSEYARQALNKYSFFKASRVIFFRIAKCNLFFKGGFDPLK
ncbi:MAG: membrane protein insertion efficiency factor YidD [Candidatus Omnitrophica bacterium]|nr:membrane protein insertion efficiency factor YidD [Candidatus Omnitrophota bacterium]MCM8831292.1 membrane protein insertion efficiency factor YidD [Candidatus Omnitrophota bacterium]